MRLTVILRTRGKIEGEGDGGEEGAARVMERESVRLRLSLKMR